MTKYRIFLVGLISMATAACAAIVVAYVFRDPINESTYAKIQEGMTEAEVEAILGLAQKITDGRLGNNVIVPFRGADGKVDWIRVTSTKEWKGSTMTIRVCFLEGGTVYSAEGWPTGETLIQKVRRWLGLEPTRFGSYRAPESSHDVIPD